MRADAQTTDAERFPGSKASRMRVLVRSKQKSSAVPCAKVLRHISTELDSQLSRVEYRQIKEHLRRCPNCTIYLDSLKKIVYLYQHFPARHPSGRSRRKLRAVLHLKMKTGTTEKSDKHFGLPVPPYGIPANRNRQAGLPARRAGVRVH
jgi:hypothetical protein